MSSLPELLIDLRRMAKHFDGEAATERREQNSPTLVEFYLEAAVERRRFADDLEELLERDKTLAALEAAGVDNWEGYELAMEQQ